MKIEELRLGNKILFNGVVQNVTMPFLNYMYVEPKPYKTIKPIPITEKILDKIKNKTDRHFIKFNKNGDLLICGNIHYDIKYLHQLQNIWYFLMFRELEFEL